MSDPGSFVEGRRWGEGLGCLCEAAGCAAAAAAVPYRPKRRSGEGRRFGGAASGASRDALRPRAAGVELTAEPRPRRGEMSHGDDWELGDEATADPGEADAGDEA